MTVKQHLCLSLFLFFLWHSPSVCVNFEGILGDIKSDVASSLFSGDTYVKGFKNAGSFIHERGKEAWENPYAREVGLYALDFKTGGTLGFRERFSAFDQPGGSAGYAGFSGSVMGQSNPTYNNVLFRNLADEDFAFVSVSYTSGSGQTVSCSDPSFKLLPSVIKASEVGHIEYKNACTSTVYNTTVEYKSLATDNSFELCFQGGSSLEALHFSFQHDFNSTTTTKSIENSGYTSHEIGNVTYHFSMTHTLNPPMDNFDITFEKTGANNYFYPVSLDNFSNKTLVLKSAPHPEYLYDLGTTIKPYSTKAFAISLPYDASAVDEVVEFRTDDNSVILKLMLDYTDGNLDRLKTVLQSQEVNFGSDMVVVNGYQSRAGGTFRISAFKADIHYISLVIAG